MRGTFSPFERVFPVLTSRIPLVLQILLAVQSFCAEEVETGESPGVPGGFVPTATKWRTCEKARKVCRVELETRASPIRQLVAFFRKRAR